MIASETDSYLIDLDLLLLRRGAFMIKIPRDPETPTYLIVTCYQMALSPTSSGT